jgi:DNA-binding Xre family transcriptional regulator
MAADGIPEFAAKCGGEEIARLRTKRGWTRAKLMVRLYAELERAGLDIDSVSESWLARLEQGRVVKVPRSTLEAVCQALECTRQECARVLLYADRNVLSRADSEPDVVAELLNGVVANLYDDAHDMLSNMIGPRRLTDLDEQEQIELVASALQLVLKQRRKR